MDNSELQKRYFAALRNKYQVGRYESTASDSFLYLILRKKDYLNLRPKYKIPEDLELSITSPVYSVLWKVEAEDFPTDSELELLSSYNLTETTRLIRDVLIFLN